MSRKDRPPLKKAEAVTELLKKILGDTGLDDRLPRYQAWLVWDKVVGEQIARHARPLRIREKILEVQVDNPVWMQQLQMLKPQILKKIHTQLPNCDIEEIYLRRGNPQKRIPVAAEPIIDWRKEELSPQDLAEIEASLSGLEDGDLKNEMRQLFARQKKLNKAKKE